MLTRAYKSLLPALAGLIILPSLARAAAATPLYPSLSLQPQRVLTAQATDPSTRYGLGLLDSRSIYGQGWFPDSFRQHSLDAGNGLGFDYFHGEGHHKQVDELTTDIEWNPVGQLTLGLEGGWSSQRATVVGVRERAEAWDTVKIKAHHPIFQYVSPDGTFDYVLVAKLALGLPLTEDLRHDPYEINPLLGQMFKLGDRFSIQTWTGVNFLVGPRGGGEHQFHYGVIFGYRIEHDDLPLPGVETIIPVLELDGSATLGGESRGSHQLFAVVGLRAYFDAIGPVAPALGIGYMIPLDQGARADLSGAIITSISFGF